MKIAFVTNICAHYNVGTFELLGRHHNVDYYFFSAGREWYWQEQHGYRRGNFHSEYLPGFQIGQTRVTPSLSWKLFQKGYDVYIKCINGRFALPLTYLIARIRRKPFILWTGVWMRLQTRMQRLVFPLTRYIYLHSDAIVVYGEHVKKYLVSEGVAPEKIFVAYHATDNGFYGSEIQASEKDALLKDLNVPAEHKIVLYLGRLEESKGVEYLVRAFAQLPRPDVTLVIAGTGSLRDDLQKLAVELNIQHKVRFTEYVPIESAPLYYNTAFVYVLPSVTLDTGKEPWGLVVNEAFNQGVPVIVTEAVGAAAGGLVQDGVNGFIVPERDSGALADSLKRIIENPGLQQTLGENAKRIIAEWDYQRNVNGYLEAIRYALDSKKI